MSCDGMGGEESPGKSVKDAFLFISRVLGLLESVGDIRC